MRAFLKRLFRRRPKLEEVYYIHLNHAYAGENAALKAFLQSREKVCRGDKIGFRIKYIPRSLGDTVCGFVELRYDGKLLERLRLVRREDLVGFEVYTAYD